MVFHGIKNGTTVYIDDVKNNGWSIAPIPHQVIRVVCWDGVVLEKFKKGTRFVDSIVGMHHIEAIAVFHKHVIRRQLYYTILSRERGLTEWGLRPYLPRGFIPSSDANNGLLQTLYLQILLPKCILNTQNKFPIIAYLRNNITLELTPIPMEMTLNLNIDAAALNTETLDTTYSMSFFRGVASALVNVPTTSASSPSYVGLTFYRDDMFFGKTEIEFCNMNYELSKFEFLSSYDGKDINVYFPPNIVLSNIHVKNHDNNMEEEEEGRHRS